MPICLYLNRCIARCGQCFAYCAHLLRGTGWAELRVGELLCGANPTHLESDWPGANSAPATSAITCTTRIRTSTTLAELCSGQAAQHWTRSALAYTPGQYRLKVHGSSLGASQRYLAGALAATDRVLAHSRSQKEGKCVSFWSHTIPSRCRSRPWPSATPPPSSPC